MSISTENLRTFKSLTAGSNVIMPNGKKLTFAGPLGGHGAYVTANPEEQRYLEEMVKSTNGQVWEEAPPEVEAKIVAAAEITADKQVVQADLTKTAVTAVNPTLAAMQAKLGQVPEAKAQQ